MMVFEQFRKSYGKTEILGIPHLQLQPGVYWLRGDNGAGKSTLMRSIAGMIPYEGNITVNEMNIRRNRLAYTSVVNYAEAEPLYPGFLTGSDLVQFYAASKRAPAGQAQSLCEQMGVHTFMGNRVATYSSGMTKKLSLVLGLIGNPQLVLLDEPLITLDTTSTGILQQIVNEYADRGVSFIISSHQDMVPGTRPMTQLYIKNKTIETA
ncbi:ABC transporter ATP-binding protein [Nemorincola caseinilytica]|uniref:ABC transporter ATP-binding protein n=1 Tax=Nemorincola caseinilytica TaxID=2054315 RepID=A0ABP8N5B4_9BACT